MQNNSPSREAWLAELVRLGVGSPIVRLATGEIQDPIFAYWCQTGFQYHNDQVGDTEIVPLWQYGLDVTGCRLVDDRLEFVEYCVEDLEAGVPDAMVVVGYSDQGLLARLFFHLIENENCSNANESERRNRLQQAADLVGFVHLDEAIQEHARCLSESKFNYHEFSRSL